MLSRSVLAAIGLETFKVHEQSGLLFFTLEIYCKLVSCASTVQSFSAV